MKLRIFINKNILLHNNNILLNKKNNYDSNTKNLLNNFY
jgi:hypothetical protein